MLSTRVQQRLGSGLSYRSQTWAGRRLVQRHVSTEQATEAPPATTAQQEDSSVPSVDFRPSNAAQSGYVEYDTAGQTNMYPVVTKAYEVPLGGDTSSATSATNNTALIAGGLALALIVIGLGALTATSGSEPTTTEELASLTQYAANFAGEL